MPYMKAFGSKEHYFDFYDFWKILIFFLKFLVYYVKKFFDVHITPVWKLSKIKKLLFNFKNIIKSVFLIFDFFELFFQKNWYQKLWKNWIDIIGVKNKIELMMVWFFIRIKKLPFSAKNMHITALLIQKSTIH